MRLNTLVKPAFWASLGVVLLITACQSEPAGSPEALEPTSLSQSDDSERSTPTHPGQRLFEDNCATCHGVSGGGTGMLGRPIDFTNTAWQKSHTADFIATTVKNGRGMMPAFETTFSEAELADLVSYVKSLGEKTE